jgi:hypothetical protein
LRAVIGIALIIAGLRLIYQSAPILVGDTVPQNYPLTSINYRGTVICIGRTNMANVVTVLHIAPVTSAVEAVKAAIVQEFKNSEPATEA